MNKNEKQEFVDKTGNYIESERVQDIFKSLMKEIIYKQPSDPLQHLIDHLSQQVRQKLVYFIIGPNNEQNATIAENLSASANFKHIDMFEILKNASDQAQFLKELDNHALTVSDQKANIAFQQHFSKLPESCKGCIVSCFPVSMGQMQFIQKMGINVSRLFILNYSQENQLQIMNDFCTKHNLNTKPQILSNVFHQSIRDIKLQNRDLYFTDINIEKQDPTLSIKVKNFMQTIIDLQNKKTAPLRPPRIMIIRPKQVNIGKSLVKELSQHYDLFSIIQTQCIQQQIDLKTDLGKLLHDNCIFIILVEHKTFTDDTMNDIFSSYLKNNKARTYGWISEGFPRNLVQLNKFKNERIEPSMVKTFIQILVINAENSEEQFNQLKKEVYKIYDTSKILEVNEKDDIKKIVLEKINLTYK